MRRHSFLRLGSYVAPPATGEAGQIIITPGTSSVWGTVADLPLRSLVYISGSNEVSLANATSLTTMKAIGFVSSKNNSDCGVQANGELSGFSGLTPGAVYYAGKTPGSIWTYTEEDSDFPPYIQMVGTAKTESILLVAISNGPFIGAPV